MLDIYLKAMMYLNIEKLRKRSFMLQFFYISITFFHILFFIICKINDFNSKNTHINFQH